MRRLVKKAWEVRRSWGLYLIVICVLHVTGAIGLLSGARENPAFWGLGLLAYTLGLRHAFDADHIAAIDNTVRKLIQQKRNPLGVGFFFSLGHSTVVFLMVLAVAFSVQWMHNEMPQVREIGGLIGSVVLGGFLVVIGMVNLAILANLVRIFRKMKHETGEVERLEAMPEPGGLFSRLVKPMYRLINRSWHVYPLGFLFGLGFDTATEITLLSISANAAEHTISVLELLSLPALFAAGMTLMDTADGIFMTTAYRWAFYKPMRKMVYNLTVTAVSVAAALLIGGAQLFRALVEYLPGKNDFLHWAGGLDFGSLGYILMGLFALAWGLSAAVRKSRDKGFFGMRAVKRRS